MFDNIRDLPDNWNGNGALAFDEDLLDFAEEVVSSITLDIDIFPTANSSIQIEYHDMSCVFTDIYFECEVFIDRIELYYTNGDDKHYEVVSRGDNHIDKLLKFINTYLNKENEDE